MDILDIRSLRKQFADHLAVKEINLQVKKGEFFSILGPSGCGKTTLLRMISGFIEQTSGEIFINKKSMRGIPANKRPVNLVFQNLALFPMMNVYENIAFGLKRRKVAKDEIEKKVKEILEKVHLSGYEKKDVSSLSGGQKQRVAIARSLILEPSILLLDEPLGALDLKLRESMKIELKKLQHEFGTTFIYITHDQSEALVMSDRVAVMNQGVFEQIDTPQNLYANPKTAFVASFVGETNILESTKISNEKVKSDDLEFHSIFIDEVTDTCSLFIRPEAIIINPSEDIKDINRFEVDIINILFDGSNTKLLATLPNNKELMISLPQNEQFKQIEIGHKIKVGVSKKDCKVFK